MKKKTVVSVMAVAMLFAVSLFFVGGTYARYAEEFTGDASVDVAKWNVALGGVGQPFELTLSPTHSDHVVDGKIAPSYTATGTMTLNLTGTEVSVDIFSKIDDSQLKSRLSSFGIDSESITTKVSVKGNGKITDEFTQNGDQTAPFVVKLPEGKAFEEADTLTLTVTVTWDNKNDEKVTSDTAGGKYAYGTESNLKVPITLYAVQHIEGESYSPAGA